MDPDRLSPEPAVVPASRGSRVRWTGLVEAAGMLSVGASLGAGVGGNWWWGDLLAQFRPVYAVAMLALTAVMLRTGRRPLVPLALLLTVVQAWRVAGGFRGGPPGADAVVTEPGWTCLLANVRTADPRPDRVLEAVTREDPDLVALLEVDDAWMAGLEPLARSHPHGEARTRSDNFGLALWSRHPVVDVEELFLGPGELPALAATVRAPRGDLRVLVFHALPPAGPAGARARDAMLAGVAAWCGRQTGPVVVMGDFNTVPWAPSFARFRKESGLSAPARWVGTWPAGAGHAGLPLDHVLVRGGLRVGDYRAGPAVGSDHRTLVATWR